MGSSKTKVIFRKFKDDKSIIAIFPTECGTNGPYACSSYMHLGQHGSADPYGLTFITTLAKPEEYESLRNELTRLGYNLDIRKRTGRQDLAEREKKLKL